ncbi:phospholipase [Streptomyces sp. Je 1-369]|uniref:phospholipase n=1 Tax=Streptomyces sp. Je 1-369 TaxID=2966192 RepID=UPI0022863AA1|nr:phospholipase [Streptomyces sp. Je 1-369]WAL99698.1 phospholipase [Streptomyces sp. Je 1-369]
MIRGARTRSTARAATLAAASGALAMGLAAPQASAAADDAPQAESQAKSQAESQDKRPVWAIAHRVLTADGVDKALDHGANAMEIDATAWKKGWWADHDGLPTSSGDTMSDMFDRIAQQRRAGKNIGFVWLDLKNPDYCDSGDTKWRHCSVAALRDLARTKLESAGVRVLYGFYGTAGGTGWKDVSRDLTDLEGVDISGDAEEVRSQYGEFGGAIANNQRVMDKGLFNLNLPTVLGNVAKQVRLGSEARDRGELARVFGWTTAAGDGEATNRLLDASGGNADGLIYGHRASCYPDGASGTGGCGKDESDAKQAIAHIHEFVRSHAESRRMATTDDVPFGNSGN